MRAAARVGVSLTAAAVLAGCARDGSPSPSTSVAQAPATPATTAPPSTLSPDALKAALLQPADLPGSTVSQPDESDVDLSACFPGNPLGAKTDAREVDGPDLEVVQGAAQRFYSSSARQGTPEQAKAFVATFATPTGSACVLEAFKRDLSADPTPPKVDASGLTGSVAPAAVGDGGALLPVTGNLRSEGGAIRANFELLFFSKGPVVVLLSNGAVQGTLPKGQSLELGTKIAGRL